MPPTTVTIKFVHPGGTLQAPPTRQHQLPEGSGLYELQCFVDPYLERAQLDALYSIFILRPPDSPLLLEEQTLATFAVDGRLVVEVRLLVPHAVRGVAVGAPCDPIAAAAGGAPRGAAAGGATAGSGASPASRKQPQHAPVPAAGGAASSACDSDGARVAKAAPTREPSRKRSRSTRDRPGAGAAAAPPAAAAPAAAAVAAAAPPWPAAATQPPSSPVLAMLPEPLLQELSAQAVRGLERARQHLALPDYRADPDACDFELPFWQFTVPPPPRLQPTLAAQLAAEAQAYSLLPKLPVNRLAGGGLAFNDEPAPAAGAPDSRFRVPAGSFYSFGRIWPLPDLAPPTLVVGKRGDERPDSASRTNNFFLALWKRCSDAVRDGRLAAAQPRRGDEQDELPQLQWDVYNCAYTLMNLEGGVETAATCGVPIAQLNFRQSELWWRLYAACGYEDSYAFVNLSECLREDGSGDGGPFTSDVHDALLWRLRAQELIRRYPTTRELTSNKRGDACHSVTLQAAIDELRKEAKSALAAAAAAATASTSSSSAAAAAATGATSVYVSVLV